MSSLPINFFTSGNIKDIVIAAVLLSFTLLEYKYKLVTELKKFTSFYYIVISICFFIAWMIVTFALDFTKFSGSIIDFRVFSIFDVGHWIVWFSVFLILLRYGVKDFLVGWLFVAILVTIHEGAWFLTYFVAYPSQFGVTLWFYSPFLVWLLINIPAYIVMVPRKEEPILPMLTDSEKQEVIARKTFGKKFEYAIRRLWKVLPKAEKIENRKIYLAAIVMIVFDIMWYLAGFHVTIDNVFGPTIYYFNSDVNLIEDLSWVVPTLILIL